MPAQRIFALCGLCNISVVSSQNYAKVRKGSLPGGHFLLHGKRRFGFTLHRQHQAGAIPFGFDFAPGVGRNNAQHTRVPGGCQTALLHLAAQTQKRLVRARVAAVIQHRQGAAGRQSHSLTVSGRRIGQHHRRQHQNRYHHRDAELSTAFLRRMSRTAAPWPPTPSCLLHV